MDNIIELIKALYMMLSDNPYNDGYDTNIFISIMTGTYMVFSFIVLIGMIIGSIFLDDDIILPEAIFYFLVYFVISSFALMYTYYIIPIIIIHVMFIFNMVNDVTMDKERKYKYRNKLL